MKRFRLIGYGLVLAIAVMAVRAQDMDIGQWTRAKYHVVANGIYTPTFTNPTVMNTFNVNISNAGTSWVLTLETGESTPKVLWRWVTATGAGNFTIALPVGITMASGIRVRASGGTAGVADVELTHRGANNPTATPFTTQTPTATASSTSTPTNTPTPTPTPTSP